VKKISGKERHGKLEVKVVRSESSRREFEMCRRREARKAGSEDESESSSGMCCRCGSADRY